MDLYSETQGRGRYSHYIVSIEIEMHSHKNDQPRPMKGIPAALAISSTPSFHGGLTQYSSSGHQCQAAAWPKTQVSFQHSQHPSSVQPCYSHQPGKCLCSNEQIDLLPHFQYRAEYRRYHVSFRLGMWSELDRGWHVWRSCMRTSLLSALFLDLDRMGRTWTGRINGDRTVVYYPTSFGRLRLHEDECLFCALHVSSSFIGVRRDVQGQQP
jgi:hypothetical protein